MVAKLPIFRIIRRLKKPLFSVLNIRKQIDPIRVNKNESCYFFRFEIKLDLTSTSHNTESITIG